MRGKSNSVAMLAAGIGISTIKIRIAGVTVAQCHLYEQNSAFFDIDPSLSFSLSVTNWLFL